jgi:hypothetical protein
MNNLLYLITLILGAIFILILILVIARKSYRHNKVIKERAALKSKLQELKIFNQKILDNVPVSIAVCDSQGDVLMTNSFFRKIVPWYDPIKGLNLIKSERLKIAGLSEKYANALKSGITFSQKGVLVKAPKPYYSFYINFDVIPLKNDEGKIIGALSIGQEITSLMKAKDNLTKINQQLDQEVKRRTEEFYQINNQLSEKIDFYERIFDFLTAQIQQTLEQIQNLNSQALVGEEERRRHDKFFLVFNDFIILNKIEKGQLFLDLERVALYDYIQKIFGQNNNKLTIENLANTAQAIIDQDKIRHVLQGIYNRFKDNSEQTKLIIEKRGHQLWLTLEFDIKPTSEADSLQNNFFWDIQLFMYKEIIHLHKGVLTEKLDNNHLVFNLKLLVAN